MDILKAKVLAFFTSCVVVCGCSAHAEDAVRSSLQPYAVTRQERDDLVAKAKGLTLKTIIGCRTRTAAREPDALAVMGLAYENGYGVKKDAAEAYACYSKAAEQGHAFSQNMTGSFLRDGTGINQDLEKALYWFERCSRLGNSNCVVNIGTVYDKRSSYENALAVFFEAGAIEHPVSLYNIGYYYYTGKGPLEPDHSEAFSYFLRAARLGYPPAQLAVAAAYANGDGVAMDGDEAMKWLTECARLGSAECEAELKALDEPNARTQMR